MKKLHALVAVVGLASISVAAYVYQRQDGSRGKDTASAPPAAGRPAGSDGPAAVEVARAGAMRLRDETSTVGSLRSRQGVMLRPEASGRIDKLGFSDGARVRRGQLLVQLDDTLQRAQLAQAKAQASIARTNLQRNRDLASQNFVSQSAVDQSAAALEVAEAQVALADAQLVRMRVLAPFDGVAGIRLVNVGDYVKDGADLVSIDDVAGMLVDFRLPEGVLSRLKVGQVVDVTLDGLPGKAFKGRVDAFDSQLDANGRSLLVRASLANDEGLLRPGMFARARLVFSTRDDAVVVPEEALVPQGGRQFVVKVVEGPQGPATERLEARMGLRVPGKVEIMDGLKVGDLVVTAGQARLMRADGLPVKVVQFGEAAASAPQAAERVASAGSAAQR
ncbi:efflux RND transporter periplasmic adaptor subunit [Piscinibacter gummiphilus]|uniref:Efflux transporter periplasmic adaptor subunit n=1 Tax=Piscinibacter gummiphilus TaxID=946333 RepID=A0A1W6LAI1_9BURK|nr:efflux RND transporter periplasmic adaptor subunit [Piscinibacter gummiphilus]ARN21289.1 efflux transporter periplasmic adaptor subunit [Piscinibacter gummiphilus]ATU65975.1 efflux RND transporter periplasmic adaptor subunit [Piscinibacter gummiphilus]